MGLELTSGGTIEVLPDATGKVMPERFSEATYWTPPIDSHGKQSGNRSPADTAVPVYAICRLTIPIIMEEML